MVVEAAKRKIDENFRAVLCDTKTGQNVITEVPMSDLSWGLRLNAPGPVSVSIPLGAKEVRKMDIRNATTGIMRSLGVSYDNQLLECGPIWGVDYDEETEELHLEASGIWSILNGRKIIKGSAMTGTGREIIASTLNVGPTNIPGIARELVRNSIEDNPYAGGTAGALNIVLPDVSGAGVQDDVRDYRGYDLRWVGQTLRDLTEWETLAPDIRFRPQFTPGDPTTIQWLMETGTEQQPLLKQPGPPWRFDGTVRHSPVVGFGGAIDYTKVAARAWRPGAGQERDMRLGVATDTSMVDLGMPWTEIDTADKQEDSDDALNSRAGYDLQGARKPTATISVTVRADGKPKLGMYYPGDYARVVIPENHPIFPAGPAACRIMAIDGNDTTNVKLTLAPFAASFDGSPLAFAISETNGQ